ncbi:MAG: glycosyltransferase family 4 protein [Clostridia bacterium]|nr:glycosyltransferase family 4 protein [Clostridia bacterium]
MNVCFLLGSVQKNGGIGRVTTVLSNALCTKEDLRVSMLVYLHKDLPALYTPDEKVAFDVLYTQNLSMTKALLLKGAVKKVRAYIKAHSIDVIVACGVIFYPLAILACRHTSAKCFCWEHSDPGDSSDYRFQKQSRRFASKRCAKMIVLTKAAEAYYLERYRIKKEKLVQIYNPVDAEAAKSAGYDASSKKILSVGRLAYQKNFDRLLDIAARVLPQRPGWTWDIYGEGPARGELEKKIEDLALTGRVFLKGQVNDLYERYRDYAFMVMTSRYEGFPMSLIEGAVNRLPLVSFDVPTGPREIITDGSNGFLVAKDDDETMIGRILVLTENGEMRAAMSEKAYERAASFKMEDILEQWTTLLKTPG